MGTVERGDVLRRARVYAENYGLGSIPLVDEKSYGPRDDEMLASQARGESEDGPADQLPASANSCEGGEGQIKEQQILP